MAMDNSDAAEPNGPNRAAVKPAEVFLAETALLRKIAAGLGLRGGDIEDVLQTVSVRCLDRMTAFANRDQCRRWLIRVTTNMCITEYRRTKRFRQHAAGIGKRRPQRPVKSPVESAVSAEQVEAIQQALGELDDAYLRPLVLRYFCDLSSTEIGKTLDMPAATVRGMLRRGRLALARALMKRGIESMKRDSCQAMEEWLVDFADGTS